MNRKAQRFGWAVASLGALMIVYSIFDPTVVGAELQDASWIHVIDAIFGVALIAEGLRRVFLGRATREHEEGLFQWRDR